MKITKMGYLYIIFLVLSPLLDSISYGLSNVNLPFSLTALTRIIILIILGLYVFISDKRSRKEIIFLALTVLIYTIGHVLSYNNLYDNYSYGSIKHELQYIINYSYMIGLFYVGYKLYKRNELPDIKHGLYGMTICYLILLYLALITNTSSSTYLDGSGFKGWNLSGNSLGASLLLLFITNLSFLNKKNYKYIIPVLIGLAIYMFFFLGTRVGLYGLILALILAFISYLFIKYRCFVKRYLLVILVSVLLLGSFTVILGSKLLERRKNLDDLANNTIDPLTGELAHVTGDTITFVSKIKNNEITDMKIAKSDGYLYLYETANKLKLKSTDRRSQQFIYHSNIFINQKDITNYLFGNGYLNHYGEIILEMEVLALFYNFGIIGFVLFIGIYLFIFGKEIIYIFKNIDKLSYSYIMLILSLLMSFVLSLLTGYVYFNISTSFIISNICLLIIEQRKCDYEENFICHN